MKGGSPHPLRRALDQLLLAVAFALLTAAFHLLLARIRHPGFTIFSTGWISRDDSWMVPFGYVLTFLPIATPLALVAAMRSSGLSLRIPLTLWIALGTLSLLLIFPELHGFASLLFAAGLAVNLAPRMAARERAIWRAARAGALGLGVIAVVNVARVTWRGRAAERAAMTSLPPAAGGAPNVLLIILDTVRATSLGLYGAPLATTPDLERWAQRGVVFDHAFSTAPWTLTSHAAMFTGRYPSRQSSGYASPLADSEVTVTEVLRAHGYATAGVSANFGAASYESGLHQGFIRYVDLQHSRLEVLHNTSLASADNLGAVLGPLAAIPGARRLTQILLSSTVLPLWTNLPHAPRPAPDVSGAFLQWLDLVGDKRPYFAFLNYFDAHSPFDSPPQYASMFRSDPRPIDRYHGAIRYIDNDLGRLLAELERRGSLHNTLVIVTSDHGEQFGEHGLTYHANSLYSQLLHVPLVMISPGRIPAGVRITREVTLPDIAATILDIAGVPRDMAIGGTSLAGTWSDPVRATSDVVAEAEQGFSTKRSDPNYHGPMKALITSDTHIIRDGLGAIDAYAYRVDGGEIHGLVKDGARVPQLSAALDSAVRRHSLVWPTAQRRMVPREE